MPAPIKIAYFTHYADLYGANRSLLDLILELRRKGVVEPFVIVAKEGPLQKVLSSEGITHATIPFSTAMARRVYMGRLHHRLLQWWSSRAQARSRMRMDQHALPLIIDLLKSWQIELLHANSSVIGVGHALAKRLGLPLVQHIRELPFSHYGLTPDGGRRAYFKRLMSADAVIGISGAVRRDLPQELLNDPRFSIISNGILKNSSISAAILPSPSDPFTFAVVGWIHRGKGQVEALKAFAETRAMDPSSRMIIAGSGDLSSLRTVIGTLGLSEHVELPGFVDDPRLVYERAHCLVSCSRHEALGRAMVEAMAHSLPVIGHRSGGTVELIEHGVNGYLFSDEKDLVQRMEDVLRDPPNALRMGREARKMLGDRFSIEDRTRDVFSVYQQVLSERKHS
jgi:glycosyltransferase involved in cell wall biosynthesis